jgi:DHA2 family multidrug resistance protein-like MFS transporter
MSTPSSPQPYQGTEKLLWGIVLGVVTFWLFAGTTGTIAPAILRDINGPLAQGAKAWPNPVLDPVFMKLAVSITALFSGIFIVLFGGMADRLGRVKVALIGNGLGILGSLLIVCASGSLALPLMLLGRAIQGLSAACIMPATMALVKTCWDGKARQRAVSMWSIGSWGGSGLASIFGGYMATLFGWRSIFLISIAISAVSSLLLRGTPESRVQAQAHRFDLRGVATFLVAMMSLMVVLIFGSRLGWTRPTTLGLAAVAATGIFAFVQVERKALHAFVDFRLFRNMTFTGATLSNFLLNGTIGLLIVSQQLLQVGGNMKASQAGLLTLGYALTIVAFIRLGEKLLQRFGPRRPMIWGSLIVAASCLLLMPTHLLLSQYRYLAACAYALFGLGLAFYATPSTDAALANLPSDQAGAGAGIYKMASSLGGAIGAAISLAIFSAFSGSKAGAGFMGEFLEMQGRQDNTAIRGAAFLALLFNFAMVLVAIGSIMLTVPKPGAANGGARR